MVRASALRLGGWGSIPGRVIPKTIEMGPNSSLLVAQHQGLAWCAVTMWLSAYRRPGAAWQRRGFDSRARRHLPRVIPHFSPLSCQSTVSFPMKAKKTTQKILKVFMHLHNHHHYRVSELENHHHSRTGCCTDTCQYRLSSSLCRNICQKSSLFYTCIGPSQGWPLGLGGPLWLLVSAIHPFAV